MKTSGMIYGALGLILVTTLIVGVTNSSLATDARMNETTSAELSSSLETTNERFVALRTLSVETSATREALNLVLAERDDLKAATDELQASLVAAHEKVDATETKKKALEAQAIAVAERYDPTIVATQAGVIRELAGALMAEVAAYDEEQERKAAEERTQANPQAEVRDNGGSSEQRTDSGDTGGSNDWFGYARWKLNSIGGGWVSLEHFDGNCGGRVVNACAWPGVIRIAPGFASMGQSRQDWAIVHEYAHQFHFNNWGALMGSGTFQNLFGGDLELLANCMASAWGYWDHGHAGQCYGDRLSYAAGVWNNVV